jgi:hypothetical protein
MKIGELNFKHPHKWVVEPKQKGDQIWLGSRIAFTQIEHQIYPRQKYIYSFSTFYSNVMDNDKLMLCKTGSVTVISSPGEINDDTGLSKFFRVAFSNAGGFCI